MSKLKNITVILYAIIIVFIFLIVGFYINLRVESSSFKVDMEAKYSKIKAEKDWYRWYFSEYAAALRLAQYGEPTLDINQLLHANANEFIRIEDVAIGQVCPVESNAAFSGEFIYFGARVMPLPSDDDFHLYAMSYLGSVAFAHSGKAFDAMLSSEDLRGRRVNLDKPFGLIDEWLSKHSWREFPFREPTDYGSSALMSYNSGDIDGDGRPDFVLGRSLMLSSRGYANEMTAPRRSMFQNNTLISIEGVYLNQYTWADNGLKLIAQTQLKMPPHPNVPYIVLPLPDSKVAVRTSDGLDIYSLLDGGIVWQSTITGLSAGEVQTGAFGDFTGDGNLDVWISQVATPSPYPDKDDQIILLSMDDIKPGMNNIKNIAWFTVIGSSRYSDYDGIGTTLSPVAGDILNDGLPDLSFSGHRHMNEAGALYILPGTSVKQGGRLDITSPDVIKVLGRPMSQLAPPFHHWDAKDFNQDGYSDIVVIADNDLCAGLNAGAVYTLSGAAIAKEWNIKWERHSFALHQGLRD